MLPASLGTPILELTVRPEVDFDGSLCILCNQCRMVCPIGAVTFDGDDRIVRERCDRCGDCAQVCPSGALTQLRFSAP